MQTSGFKMSNGSQLLCSMCISDAILLCVILVSWKRYHKWKRSGGAALQTNTYSCKLGFSQK